MSLWRRHRVDAAAVALAVAVLATAVPGAAQPEQLAALCSAAALLVFLARRVQPLAVSLIAFATFALGISLSTVINAVQFLGILVVFALVGAVNRERDAVLAWLAGALTMAYATSRQPPGGRPADLVLTLGFCSIVWTAGLLVASRGRLAAQSDGRAREAESTRAEHARAAIVQERARIATELHDIVSHGLSVVVVQTVAGRRSLDDGDGADVGRRLLAVEETAREALSDMRRMLGLLQLTTVDDQEVAATEPRPGLAHVQGLLDRARSAGMDVQASGLDDVCAVGPGMGLTVYRIVQESLTNALRHAPGSAVRVCLSQGSGTLTLEVVNTAHSGRTSVMAGAGRGLIGMQQRCSVYSGTCDAGPLPDGGFRVLATLMTPPGDDERTFQRATWDRV